MKGRRSFWILCGASAFVLLVASPLACSSSAGATPCNENPWQCNQGQTCWPACPSGQACSSANCTPQFDCVASAAGIPAGESCNLTIGQATCGDLQTCVSFPDAGDNGGICRPYCDPTDPTRACAPGNDCLLLGVGTSSAMEHVCSPPPLDGDASLTVDAGGSGVPEAAPGDGREVPLDAAVDSTHLGI